MRNVIISLLCCFLVFGCKKPKAKIEKIKALKSDYFVIQGTVKNFNPTTVYLNKIIENTIYNIDSTQIVNNKFQFKGSVEYPERYALSFSNYSTKTTLILENDSIKIDIDFNSLDSPIIEGSRLNEEMSNYISNSKKIFKKIEYLFPEFQKARLENDAEELEILNDKMTAIENEYFKYTYDYLKQNPASFISAMILRDQLKLTKIDTSRIIEAYNQLSDDVINSPDAKIIAFQLNLH